MYKKNTFVIILLVILNCPFAFSQNNSINQLDAKGKKHGKWKLFLNEKMLEVKDSSKAEYCRYTFYNHGSNLLPMGGIDKSWKMDPNSDLLKQSSKIKLLDGENKWYDKEGKLKSVQKFKNGEPLIIQFFWTEKSSETWDYTKKWEGQDFTYFASIIDKNGKGTYYYQRFSYGEYNLIAEPDSTGGRFDVTTSKINGDSTFINYKFFRNGKLALNENKIIVVSKKSNTEDYPQPILHGPFVNFHTNGQKSAEGNYYYGKKTGVWQYWDEKGNVRKND